VRSALLLLCYKKHDHRDHAADPAKMTPVGPIETPSSEPPLAASSKRLVPWLIAVAFFMESLDTTILNTAAPPIRS
jgi:hypothetical protein